MEDLHFLRLWDRYSHLLTKTQQEITDLYFNYDLSLSEIAEQKNCSRQSVSDCLNTCRKKLEKYEEKLRFNYAITEVTLTQSFLMTDVGKWAESAGLTKEQREGITEILDRNYEEEVRRVIREHADELL